LKRISRNSFDPPPAIAPPLLRTETEILERAVLRKLTLRVVLFSWLLFFVSWLDRANIGYASLSMNRDLRFSNSVYGLGAGLFFAGYAAFQLPSNLILDKVGPRRWLAVLMIVWGLISASFSLLRSAEWFYVLRFAMGAAEAGALPGLMVYLIRWFPARYRGVAIGNLLTAAMVALIVMGPLSTQIIRALNGFAGWHGWQWMFVIEACPAVLCGIASLWLLNDKISQVRWLNAEERAWLASSDTDVNRVSAGVEYSTIGRLCLDPRLAALVAVYGLWGILNYGILLWLPLILKSWGHLSSIEIGWLGSIPFIFALAGTIILPRSSLRTGDRRFHLIFSATIGAFAIGASAFSPAALAFVLICLCAFTTFGLQPVFWTLPTTQFKGHSLTAAVAIVNTAAAVGGFLGPLMVGWIKDTTGSFSAALLTLAACSLAIAATVACMRLPRLSPRKT
jgi:ACS family tartrate transporter-like MFS transporter